MVSVSVRESQGSLDAREEASTLRSSEVDSSLGSPLLSIFHGEGLLAEGGLSSEDGSTSSRSSSSGSRLSRDGAEKGIRRSERSARAKTRKRDEDSLSSSVLGIDLDGDLLPRLGELSVVASRHLRNKQTREEKAISFRGRRVEVESRLERTRCTHQSDLSVPGNSVDGLLVGSSSDSGDLRRLLVVVLSRLDVVSIRRSAWAPSDAGRENRKKGSQSKREGTEMEGLDELEEYTSVDGDLNKSVERETSAGELGRSRARMN